MSIRPYPDYKRTKIPFTLGIPYEWTELPFYVLCREKIVLNSVNKELLSVFLNLGVIKYSQSDEKQVHKPSEDLTKYQLVEPGDLVLNNQQAWRGSVGVSNLTGIVSPAYYVFWVDKTLNRVYANYMFRTSVMINQFVLSSKGVGSIQRNLFYPHLRRTMIPIPSFSEQVKIACYLDWKTSQINRFIKAKKRQIELLKEQKQVIINDAVTGKIDVRTGKPYQKYKKSGVEWLGLLPEGWEVRKLKFLVKGRLKYGANASGIEYSIHLPRYIRITDFNSDGKLSDRRKLSLPIELGSEYMVEEGDILYTRSGATVGKSFQCKELSEPSCFAGYLIKATPDQHLINSDFLFNFNQSYAFHAWKNYSFSKATIENISADKYAQLKIPFPNIETQLLINKWIDDRTHVTNRSIQKIEDELTLMQEFRTRLVSDVVTGKFDIRNIKIPEFEIDNEIEGMTDRDEVSEVMGEEIVANE